MTFVSHKHSPNHITFLSSPDPLTPSSSHLFTTSSPLLPLHHPLSLHPHIFSPSHPLTLSSPHPNTLIFSFSLPQPLISSPPHLHSLTLTCTPHPLIPPLTLHSLIPSSSHPSPHPSSSHPIILSLSLLSSPPSHHLIPSSPHPLTLSHTIVHNFLLPKVSSIMPQPAVPLQTVTMFTSVADVELTVICEPHHPG